jgi:phage terminase small subunit
MKRLAERQEMFCRRFVEGANATHAARSAGYAAASARNAGYRLLRRPEIKERIAALHREQAEQARDTEILIGKLETVYRRALNADQCSAAARAVEIQAKLAAGAAGTLRAPGRRPALAALPSPPPDAIIPPEPAND